ncbi:DUF3040 domain-containing protein [Streptomyces griseus]|uniref:DUF3040 domain-containing protein n=1 Tax=Streptomyces griseus TaxID=1911 RepID=UPI00056C9ADB|nr:DUF3040 domain-containing protein [Streptomyces griseus]
MDDGDTDDVRLSPSERLALLRIEATLGRDRRFARAMRGKPAGPWLIVSVLLLAAASVFLAVMGIRTSDPVVVWCFAALWPLTLFQTFRLLRRLSRRAGRRPRRL